MAPGLFLCFAIVGVPANNQEIPIQNDSGPFPWRRGCFYVVVLGTTTMGEN